MILGPGLNVLHPPEVLIDHPMHHGHLPCGPLLSLVVTREVLFDMTVRACYPEGTSITVVHDT
jgi:hypothetical protein